MLNNQVHQVQQRINQVSQMVSQLHQNRESTRQKLMQLVQDETYVAQQMQRMQQLCQESISSLQSITVGTVGQQVYTGYSPTPTYGQGISTGVGMSSSQYQQSPTSLFNQATMSPDTYQNSQQFTSGQTGQSYVGAGNIGQVGMQGSQVGVLGQSSGVGQIMGVKSSLSDVTTMGPDVYQSSRDQLGKGPSNLNQIGQQAGITSQAAPDINQFTSTSKIYNQ